MDHSQSSRFQCMQKDFPLRAFFLLSSGYFHSILSFCCCWLLMSATNHLGGKYEKHTRPRSRVCDREKRHMYHTFGWAIEWSQLLLLLLTPLPMLLLAKLLFSLNLNRLQNDQSVKLLPTHTLAVTIAFMCVARLWSKQKYEQGTQTQRRDYLYSRAAQIKCATVEVYSVAPWHINFNNVVNLPHVADEGRCKHIQH